MSGEFHVVSQAFVPRRDGVGSDHSVQRAGPRRPARHDRYGFSIRLDLPAGGSRAHPRGGARRERHRAAGRPANPLGARAMYRGSSEYRIHGTNAPDTIGKRVSSGCIRLINADVEDLYNRVNIGTKVVVLPDRGYRAEASAPRPAKYAAPVRQQHAAPVVLRSYAAPTGRTYSASSPSASAAPVRQRVSLNDETPRPPMSISP